jgi:hypothetical protein
LIQSDKIIRAREILIVNSQGPFDG